MKVPFNSIKNPLPAIAFQRARQGQKFFLQVDDAGAKVGAEFFADQQHLINGLLDGGAGVEVDIEQRTDEDIRYEGDPEKDLGTNGEPMGLSGLL